MTKKLKQISFEVYVQQHEYYNSWMIKYVPQAPGFAVIKVKKKDGQKCSVRGKALQELSGKEASLPPNI